ncbi:MAG: pyridoxal-dependent decarboxylase [Acidobacteriota bacterium]|nr:pyridoxal-dependent decarboxylase [Acidobacteriota bacterium]
MSNLPDPQDAASWSRYVEDFRQSAHASVDWIAEYLKNIREVPVLPKGKPGDLVDALPKHAPVAGESFDRILEDFRTQVFPAVTQWNHPGFMAYFGTSASTPGILAELLIAAMNTNGLHWDTSPAVAELEQVAMGWYREWLTLPEEFFGIIYDTASTSTMHAMICAREYAMPESREEGYRAGLVVYTSEQAHSSVEKGAMAVGFGQKFVRKVPTDAEFRMRTDVLRQMIETDIKAGLRPACIVATIGTTSSTSVDPVAECAALAEEFNLWLHVDCAYAGPTAILPECVHYFKGIERAHSVVTNPHKWLMTPMDLSAFFTRKPEVLRQALSLVPEYLRSSEDPRAVHLMDYGVPLGHRFRSLKLWFILRYFGRDGIAEFLRRHMQLAQKFAAWVDADARFERVAPVPFSTVCFRLKGTDDQNKAMLAKVAESGTTFLSHTELNGKIVARIAIGNLATSEEDVALAWKLLQKAAEEV